MGLFDPDPFGSPRPEPTGGPPDNDPGNGESGATPGTAVLTADPDNRYPGAMWVRGDIPSLRCDLDTAVGVDTGPGEGEMGETAGTAVLTADPDNRFPGMAWFRSDLGEIRCDFDGTVYKAALTLITGTVYEVALV